MTKEELIQEADRQSYLYDTKYSEDYTLEDRLNRPKDFVKGAIKDLVDLLKRKSYRDGYIAGTHLPQWHEIESKISPKREISKKYMPKNEEKVLLKYHFSGDDEVHISDGYYDPYDFEFHIANNPKHRIVCVVAWAEFKEN